MEPIPPIDPNHFIHVRMVLSMVVSLALARLLSGLAKFVQHPQRVAVFDVHLLWSLFMLTFLIHFWWWEFSLIHRPAWTFWTFAFVVGYAAMLYLMCAILFPDDLAEYDGYRGYFMSRRAWFFGLFAWVLLLDIVDTRLKGAAHWQAHTPEIWLRTVIGLGACALGAYSRSERLQRVLVLFVLACQATWIARLYVRLE
jgi:hypothetical protein